MCMQVYIYIYTHMKDKRACKDVADLHFNIEIEQTTINVGGTSYQDPANQDPLSQHSENAALRN